MAKDGTARGGSRIGSGRKSKSFDEKVIEGKFAFVPAEVEKDFTPPEPKEYISGEQKMGGESCAKEIYRYVYCFLKAYGCETAVSAQLVESYSQMVSRHIQCERILSETGFLAKHPTTGEPVTTPFVKMSLDFLKAANQLWYQIYQVLKENSGRGAIPSSNDMMENLLRRVK